jgi:hypothetical protein
VDKGELIYKTNEERGYVASAWDLPDSKGDAFIQITKGDSVVREFLFPAYKVWNIAAHLPDIVDSELSNNCAGYGVAASDGLGGSVAMVPAESSGETVNVVQHPQLETVGV